LDRLALVNDLCFFWTHISSMVNKARGALAPLQRNFIILIILKPYLFRVSARYLSMDHPSGVPNAKFMLIVSILYRITFCYLL